MGNKDGVHWKLIVELDGLKLGFGFEVGGMELGFESLVWVGVNLHHCPCEIEKKKEPCPDMFYQAYLECH